MAVVSAYITVIVIWSTTPLAIKWSGEGVGFLAGVTARMIIGAVLCSVLVLLLRVAIPLHRRALQAYFAAGLGVYGAMVSVYWGAQYIPSGLVAVLYGLSPLATGIMAALWLHERSLTLARLLGMMAGLVGLVLIFHTSLNLPEIDWRGVVAVLLSMTIQAASAVWVKRLGSDLPVLTLNSAGLVVAVVLFLMSWWLLDGSWPESIPSYVALSIVYLGVVATVLGFNLYFYVLKHWEAGRLALIPLISPVAALTIGHWFNGESVPLLVVVGMACIAVGLLFYYRGDSWLQRRN